MMILFSTIDKTQLFWVVASLGIALSLHIKYGKKISPLKNGQQLIRPARIPFLGFVIAFLRGKTPLDILEEMVKENGPFIEVYRGFHKLYIIADPIAAKEILTARPKIFCRSSQHADAVKHAALDSSLLFCHDPAIWNRVRRAAAPSFRTQNIHSHLQSIWEEVNEWVDDLLEKKMDNISFEFKDEAFMCSLRVLTRFAFQKDLSAAHGYFTGHQFHRDVSALGGYISKMMTFPFPMFVWHIFARICNWEEAGKNASDRCDVACLQRIDEYRTKKLDRRENKEHSSFLDTLLRKQEGSLLTDKEVLQNVKIVYLAGTETASISISMALYFVTLHSKHLPRLQSEADKFYEHLQASEGDVTPSTVATLLPFTEAFIKETLRLQSPTSLIYMTMQGQKGEKFQLSNGLTLVPGDNVLVYIDGILRGESCYHDPWAFNPDRWLDPNETVRSQNEANFLVFGYGPRVCPGKQLAIVETTLALTALIKKTIIQLNS